MQTYCKDENDEEDWEFLENFAGKKFGKRQFEATN